jgi:Na+/proline symporter
LGGLFSISLAIFGITSGPLLGVFLVGMLSRKFNKTGALWGGIISLLTVCVVSVGAQFYIFTGILKYPTLPFNVGNCTDKYVINKIILLSDFKQNLLLVLQIQQSLSLTQMVTIR